VSEVSRHCLVKGEANRCSACHRAARNGRPVAPPKVATEKEPVSRTIADAIQIGLTVNTLKVLRDAKPHAWMLACQVCNTLSEHRRNAILSGGAVCPTCRPSPRAKLQAASAHP
jgi:mono/diheme cytochrome c family protein